MPRCAPSATSSGLSWTPSILPTSIPAGRPPAPSSPLGNLEELTMQPELTNRPRLAPGCRLGENNQQRVLLMPERTLRLNGPSLEIVEHCHAHHTIQQLLLE